MVKWLMMNESKIVVAVALTIIGLLVWGAISYRAYHAQPFECERASDRSLMCTRWGLSEKKVPLRTNF